MLKLHFGLSRKRSLIGLMREASSSLARGIMKSQSNSRELLRIKSDSLTESEAEEVLDYIAIMESLSKEARYWQPLDQRLPKLYVVHDSGNRPIFFLRKPQR